MLRLALAAALVATFAVQPARSAPFTPPSWLLHSERQFLVGFGGVRPRHVDYIAYPKKIAVIFEFNRVVICGACSAPSNLQLPRARVVRIAFERTPPHLGAGGIRFCVKAADCLGR
jgi:hypothetical protein